jgi:flagellar basal-body rod protein FlgB
MPGGRPWYSSPGERLSRIEGDARMNNISDDAIMAALGRQLTLAVARQVVSAGNLANIDTPGYRTREMSFDDLLAGEVQKMSASTEGSAPQFEGISSEEPATSEASGLQSRRDGNNVQLDRELFNMTKASADFSAAQGVLAAKFRLIRYAINEGR